MNRDLGPPDETIELDEQRFIQLVFDRRWPKYVVSWSVRQRSGDSDFPTARGEVEGLPSREASDAEQSWANVRQQAVDQAMAAASASAGEPAKQPGLIARLFGKK